MDIKNHISSQDNLSKYQSPGLSQISPFTSPIRREEISVLKISLSHNESINDAQDVMNFTPDYYTDRENLKLDGVKSNDNILKQDNRIRAPNDNEYMNTLALKKKLLENMKVEEENVKQKRYEIEKNARPSSTKRKAKENFENYGFGVFHEDYSDNLTFKPKINQNSSKMIQRQYMAEPISEVLYKDAYEKTNRVKKIEMELKNTLKHQINSEKIHPNSKKIIRKKIEDTLKQLISDAEDPNNPHTITFESLGVILNKIGVFQNLEFHKGEKTNQVSLNLNQTKIKADRLSKEIAFHENFWKVLTFASNPNDAESSLVFDILIVLIDEKNSIIASKVLDGKQLFCLENREYISRISEVNEKQKPEDLWPMDKLVSEFKKIFDDKTTFMTYYLNNVGGKSDASSKKAKFYEDVTFKPKINNKSKALDAQYSTENYMSKVVTATQNEDIKSVIKTRFDVLFEHHKYLKEKKNQKLKEFDEEDMKGCTFRPQTTQNVVVSNTINRGKSVENMGKYKKKNVEPMRSQSPTITKNAYMESTWKEIPKISRHELLYDVAKAKKEKLMEVQEQIKKKREEDEIAGCTFRPKTSNGWENLKEDSFYVGVPKGFKKTVERLHRGQKEKEDKVKEMENIPRGENYEKLRQAQANPPKFLQRPKTTKKDDVIVFVDVNIGPGKTGRIGIHKGDNPKLLAKNFARTYSLSNAMKDSLEKLLQSYIDSYTNQEENKSQQLPTETESPSKERVDLDNDENQQIEGNNSQQDEKIQEEDIEDDQQQKKKQKIEYQIRIEQERS